MTRDGFPAASKYWQARLGPGWVWVGTWFLVVVGLGWAPVYIAMWRGIDTWSAFVTLGVMGYLAMAWHAHCRTRSAMAGGSL